MSVARLAETCSGRTLAWRTSVPAKISASYTPEVSVDERVGHDFRRDAQVIGFASMTAGPLARGRIDARYVTRGLRVHTRRPWPTRCRRVPVPVGDACARGSTRSQRSSNLRWALAGADNAAYLCCDPVDLTNFVGGHLLWLRRHSATS